MSPLAEPRLAAAEERVQARLRDENSFSNLMAHSELDLDSLLKARETICDQKMQRNMNEIVRMVKLKNITQEQMCAWSLSHSRLIRHRRKNQLIDEQWMARLDEMRRQRDRESRRRTALDLSACQLRAKEMHDEMRKHILASDPNKYPKRLWAKQTHSTDLTIQIKFNPV